MLPYAAHIMLKLDIPEHDDGYADALRESA